MKILLIRHGMTLANERHLYCGSSDLSLSPKGREGLKNKCYSVPDNAVFVTSGMRRSNETMELLFGISDYTAEPQLREIDFGVFELKSYEELKDDPAYQTWITGDNHSNVPPNGESGAQMKSRVTAAFRRLLRPDISLVIVTHGGVIAALMESLYPEEGKNLYQWQPKPGCGYLIADDGYTVLE